MFYNEISTWQMNNSFPWKTILILERVFKRGWWLKEQKKKKFKIRRAKRKYTFGHMIIRKIQPNGHTTFIQSRINGVTLRDVASIFRRRYMNGMCLLEGQRGNPYNRDTFIQFYSISGE